MVERMPLIGDKFPEMKVQTTHGGMRLPQEYNGKWFVLFSHPADYTPVCTSEFVAFQKRFDQFKDLGCELIGLSIDQIFSHIKWIQWIKEKLDVEIMFPVIADDRGMVADTLGIIHPGKGTNTVRAVFIVDPNATFRAMLYYPQELGRNMDEIVRMVKALQISDSKGVGIPANWPENELIGDRVILPPPMDERGASKRMEQYGEDCYDWWFCHKKLQEK